MSNTTERRREFGAYLAGLRRHSGRSQSRFAAALCAVSGAQSLTRNEVSRWERGGRVPDVWLPAFAQLLGVPLPELEQAAAYARGDARITLPGITATLADLLPDGDALEALAAPSGRRIGATAVDDLAARVHGLRLADDVLSGGDLIAPAFRELRAAIRLYRESEHSEETGGGLLVQIGELGQIVGWIASDAGRGGDAERAYRIGISAARQAGDAPLVAQLAGSLGYHLTNTGREKEGLELAKAAVAEAGPDAPAVARALFLDRVAWAHTRTGESQSALRALGQAHAALDFTGGPPAPSWAYWVNREELEVMDARVFTELRRPLRAVPLLQEVLARYDATHAREMALYRSWLAVALADANEPEQAAEEARRVIDTSGDLSSERTADRARKVLHRLREFEDVPEAREVLNDYGHLLLTVP
ncbi:helix-turn-helix domain-containing protein [Streptomyces sp. J2-1]|uniref:helix-turn-helix domain-containing protein n=1 Tax=Streptomyces corallincola TaxID=2851888 RepID=UPI001C3810B4|nr:helix-turn-helix transcriptional regulator [Streptomyces corallincola]MBV2355654.1 helix-turn-helix domain-containing protein [Streptomyces corallincola]